MSHSHQHLIVLHATRLRNGDLTEIELDRAMPEAPHLLKLAHETQFGVLCFKPANI